MVLSANLARSLYLVLSRLMARSHYLVLSANLARSQYRGALASVARSHYVVLSANLARSLYLVLSSGSGGAHRLPIRWRYQVYVSHMLDHVWFGRRDSEFRFPRYPMPVR